MTSNEIRVFLSSTFKDMEAERQALVTHVFPYLRKICQERHVGFTEIDLRWGVTEEQSRNGYTVEVCLNEIERCRQFPPFFIGFLGERYGWIPTNKDLQAYWEKRPDNAYAAKIKCALERGISVTELELEYGILDNPNLDHICVFLRKADLTDRLYKKAKQCTPTLEETSFYDEASGKLAAVKQRLRTQNLIKIDGYANINEFAEGVKQFLINAIDKLFPADTAFNSIQRSDASHKIFAESRLKGYVPLPHMQQVIQHALSAGLAGDAHRLIHLCAPSGLGKSAFIANEALHLAANASYWIHEHYIGADGKNSFDDWVIRIYSALQATGYLTTDIPDIDEKREEFLPIALLTVQKTLQKPMVFLLDALDQFNKAAESKLSKLVASLPPRVVVFASSTPKIRFSEAQVIELPNLDEPMRRNMIQTFFNGFGKNLSDILINSLAQAPACAIPLFLRLVLEELRLHAKHETLSAEVSRMLTNENAVALFIQVLQTMDKDFTNTTLTTIATHTAKLLTAARRGLTNQDLSLLLAVDHFPNTEKYLSRIPDQLLAPLLAQLERFLLRDQGRSYLMHEILRNTFIDNQDTKNIRHELIDYATYLGNLPWALVERLYQNLQLTKEDPSEKNLSSQLAVLQPLHNVIILITEDANLVRKALQHLGANSLTPLGEDWAHQLQANHDPNTLLQTIILLKTLRKWYLSGFGRWPRCVNLSLPVVKMVLAIHQKTLPEGHPDIEQDFLFLREIYSIQENEAMQARYQDDLEQDNNTQWPAVDEPFNEPEYEITQELRTFDYLADHYNSEEAFDELCLLYKEKLKFYHSNFPDRHSDIANCLIDLGQCYQKLEQLDKAEQLFKEALIINRTNLPAEDPAIVSSLNNLASLYEAQGKFDKAVTLCEEALAINRAILSPENPSIATSLNKLADLYATQGQVIKAKLLLGEAQAMNNTFSKQLTDN
ncbi:MAG: tetratricopeptide repeat protein [Thiobacillus sp.]